MHCRNNLTTTSVVSSFSKIIILSSFLLLNVSAFTTNYPLTTSTLSLHQPQSISKLLLVKEQHKPTQTVLSERRPTFSRSIILHAEIPNDDSSISSTTTSEGEKEEEKVPYPIDVRKKINIWIQYHVSFKFLLIGAPLHLNFIGCWN